MTRPFFADDWLTVYAGDCRVVLPTLAADSVDCIVTSPPYWGLRDYGTATWVGGDEACDHAETYQHVSDKSTLYSPGEAVPGAAAIKHGKKIGKQYEHICRKCGATRQDAQLGIEATPELYVANLVAVFRELRRVLKGSGTCWLNLGDSYAGSGRGGNPEGSSWKGYVGNADRERAAMPHLQSKQVEAGAIGRNWVAAPPGLKGKDLVGIPWRVAFALQADGWYLRSDIIWSKPNPMPESVTDRPTKAHEYLFLLTKSARYFYDADAVREANSEFSIPQLRPARTTDEQAEANLRNDNGRLGGGSVLNPAGRNLRSVWTIATRPYPGAHFAVFPPELPERCIKAGSSERGVCPECGAPWGRVVEREPGFESRRQDEGGLRGRRTGGSTNGYRGVGILRQETTGWRPTCPHPTDPYTRGFAADPTPAIVLDPFAGSGTVGLVAQKLNRRAILIDLNPDYILQAMRRNAQTPLGLGA